MKTPDPLATEPGLHALQFVGRALFALLVALYLLRSNPVVADFAPAGWMIWAAVAGYIALHALWLYKRPAATNVPAALLDLLSIGLVILLDPGTPPPALVLLVVAALSAGLVHGLRRFLWILAGGVLVVALVIPARLARADDAPTASTLFLLAVILVCVLYFGLMVYRNQVLARQAREATWRDPQTGLISHAAMISTAGWLLPLHDRLSTQMTLVLMRPNHAADLKKLADRLATRLRRSDIAARYDDQTLAVLLPDTGAGDAERLLDELRAREPGWKAAVLALANPEHSLEAALEHLHRTLARAREDDSHWLVHATTPGY